ncbi:hypothetical protein ABT391_21565, partial [Streptomyces jumonjinensis]|uniref:hypothetical protein n=1 Tax=Streptomyces jumonjinensis TaxID=1945 RepID=UPI003322A6A6
MSIESLQGFGSVGASQGQPEGPSDRLRADKDRLAPMALASGRRDPALCTGVRQRARFRGQPGAEDERVQPRSLDRAGEVDRAGVKEG